MTAAEVRALLNEIVDPCSIAAGAPAGLVEMGLVRDVHVSAGREGAIVTILIGLTEPGCMMGASFAVQARERLEPLPGVARVEVELQHDCDWTPADLDARYARRLEEVRAAARRSREVGVS